MSLPDAAPTPERLLTSEEIAGLLGLSVYAVRCATYRRALPHVKIGRLVRFRWSDVQAALRSVPALAGGRTT
jgi:excisionase family DNA binding protein